jgi:hypothetical protein
LDITSLFAPVDPKDLTPTQLEIRRRYTVAATYLLDHPYHSDDLLRDHLIGTFGISRTQAYRDIAEVRKVTGNIKNAGKEWHRHVANTMALETYNDAKASSDLKARNAAIANYIKINKINREDVDDFNWERVIPPAFEPSPDITVLNLPEKDTRDVNARREALRKKFMSTNITDIQPLEE